MGFLRRLSLMRHGRGFGVHSPLGYELITAVLRDKPAYYADAELKKLYKGRRDRRIARIIIRLTARFEPKTIHCAEKFHPVIKLTGKRLEDAENKELADMAITRTDTGCTITVGKEGEHTGPLVLDNEKDLLITVYRPGLSPTRIPTTL